MRRTTVPRFKSDREAAAFWDRRASASYLADLKEVTVRILPALRRRVVARAKARRRRRARAGDDVQVSDAVTVRLAPAKLAAVRTVAGRKHVPCDELIERWITAGLEREEAGRI